MKFLHQVKFEIRNIIRSRFLLIIGILILLASIAIPVLGLFDKNGGGGIINPIEPTRVYAEDSKTGIEPGGGPDDKPGQGKESIIVNGVTIYSDNPFYWQLQDLVRQKTDIENNSSQFSSPKVVEVITSMIEMEINYYVRYAQSIATYNDYRYELAWQGLETLYDKYFYEHADLGLDVLSEAASYRKGIDPNTLRIKYIDITPQERLEGISKADENLGLLYAIVDNSDFPNYIDLKIRMANDMIKSFEDNIKIQEQLIIDNPDQEDNINLYIEDLRRQINLVKTNTIPILQLRLRLNIIPYADVWQNRAISDIESSRNNLAYLKIMTEEEFNEMQQGGGNNGGWIDIEEGSARDFIGKPIYPGYGGYSNYREYVAYMQAQINNNNKIIYIAEASLESNKPDMKYVPYGSRSRTVTFLDYSIFIALFGVLLGGWLIASEHQQGTIRLLMIRPKTRFKILAAKFTAAIVICISLYLAGSLLDFIANGVLYGFTDYTFPNYAIGGATSFLAYYLPKLLICIVPILFAFSLAFMLSVVVKNVAVSIAIPFVFFIGSIIAVPILAYTQSISWLIYTPIPFILLSQFFHQSTFQNIINNGIPISLTYGIILMAVLASACAAIAALVFKKKDIVN